MTALNFLLMEDMVSISMDTLSLSMENRMPYKFVSKFVHLPQMNCVICGTGNMLAIIHWIAYVQERMAANGIYQLNLLTSQRLKEFMKREVVNAELSTTIYQFGLSELDNNFHGYAYRSTNNFESEEIAYGIGVKPPEVFIENGTLNMELIGFDGNHIEESFIRIMEKQKERDDMLPEKVGIGGCVQLIILTRGGAITKTINVFDDFEEQYTFVCKQLKS
ncbi:hypothetical protein [Anaerobium acetethylicum]|uniref:Uncharacterized protein n=1 Tax=Anaerobium acetethylicum TaxID=1619234 RepID=A0A1D3TYJ4_9FIRM|nr:hypothetical protein [Anaerobium acetethylicum]SCP99552.1 hypothetical protein SAMN05421730_10465 [Anaerobium acetethylicum]